MRCRLVFSVLASVIAALGSPHSFCLADEGGAKDFETLARPLLKTYCFECHSGDVTEAEIDLGSFGTFAQARKDLKVWMKVRQMLESGQMPPKDADQPGEEERTKLQKWVRAFLTAEAKAHAGDPGPVLLRRLSNAEYNYTIRDLTGVETLDPTREFPIDGAAGEGFTNTGSGQGMSPALLQKYLDAGKQVAAHMVLLPDGVRFSPHTTERDRTDALLARIQQFYRRFTEDGEGMPVNLQGIQFNTNQGGLLPLKSYLIATIAERESIASGRKTIVQVANERGLNAKYLQILWETLTSDEPGENSVYLKSLRSRWQKATEKNVPDLVRELSEAQKTLWKFNTVGHIGRVGGPTAWMEAVSPIRHEQEIALPLSTAAGQDIALYLSAGDLGDGNDQDVVVWQEPRIVFPAEDFAPQTPPILLRDVRSLTGRIEAVLDSELPRTAEYLKAVSAIREQAARFEVEAKARKLDPELLARWALLIGLDRKARRQVMGHFIEKKEKVGGYEAVNGWGDPQTPSMLTNRSKEAIPLGTLTVPARSVVMHPSPEMESFVAWQSPTAGEFRFEGLIADADGNCGNGASWRLELLSETGRAVLAEGTIDNGGRQKFQGKDPIAIAKGDIVFLIVNARENNHVCDTTHIELKLSETAGEKRVWDLARDVVDQIAAGNPLSDSLGHENIWHFGAIAAESAAPPQIPPQSSLARWKTSLIKNDPPEELQKQAQAVETAVTADDPSRLPEADRELRRKLLAWRGPLDWLSQGRKNKEEKPSAFGLDPASFGKHSAGSMLRETDLCIKAPDVIEVKLPAELAVGGVFTTTAVLEEKIGREGSVQVHASLEKPGPNALSLSAPILVQKGSRAEKQIEASAKSLRELFPPALCYAKIVPVDETVTLMLYHREDHHLRRLMLSEAEASELDRLWEELFYIAEEPLKAVVALEQISEFATQDRPDLVKDFAPLAGPARERAKAFREKQIQAEPLQIESLLAFANRAWRRPLSEAETQSLREFYQELRREEIAHEESLHLLLARVLTSPAFLYKLEQPAPGKDPGPVSDRELASRLSYFLWSSAPDNHLRQIADAGTLKNEEVLLSETKRMLDDPNTRRLAIEFACQWLHVRNFDQNDDKNESLYPEFAEMRGEMYEETVRFFEDMFRNDGSVLDILNADHTFLNEALAKHYGIEGTLGEDWRRVEKVQSRGRGGVLGMATILASQSGASRTSPILRGNWVYETLLGERLPRPPANVPVLPDAIPEGLTARQLIERHSSDPSCAKCHVKIDPYGFALEQFDAIGRTRPEKSDTKTTLPNGKPIEGLEGLRDYLLTDRREDVVRQFCRKLLGFALGRELQLSDEPLLEEIEAKLKANGFRFHVAVETIVKSPQFRNIRGREFVEE